MKYNVMLDDIVIYRIDGHDINGQVAWICDEDEETYLEYRKPIVFADGKLYERKHWDDWDYTNGSTVLTEWTDDINKAIKSFDDLATNLELF